MKHIAMFVLGSMLFITSQANAATRTVCFDLKIADNRVDCAAPADPGAKRACESGGHVWAVGHRYEVWDKDDDGDDELIGDWTIGGTGTRCVTFEWEGTSYDKGEANPDVYLKYVNAVRKSSGTGRIVTAVQTDGSAHPKTSWRSNAVATDCTSAATCYILPSGYMIPTVDEASDRAQRILALDNTQHGLEVFGELFDQDVAMHFPGDSAVSHAVSRTEYHVRSTGGDEGMVAPHELGHVLQMQLFGQDSLRDSCGGSHSLTSIEFQSCATTEGFADYAAVVGWFEPNSTVSEPWGWNFDFAQPLPTSATASDNAGIEGQVARAFWDMDDWDDESGQGACAGASDGMRYASTSLALGWAEFADGTANREDFENDDDGVNMKDYYYNNDTRIVDPNFWETALELNCLDSQDTN